MTWPPRWDKPHFKEPVSAKVVRGTKRADRVAKEQAQMQLARRRDKYCRFPLCGCRTFQLRTEVSHQRHRGIGGNPTGDRTQTPILLLLCSARHKENRVSIDRGTLRWRPLTDQGADGPVAWDVDLVALGGSQGVGRARWSEVARETGLHAYEPPTPGQLKVLALLAAMQL